jgi:hypothetical protein
MKNGLRLVSIMALISACSQPPAPADSKKAGTVNPANINADAMQSEKKNIEQAADAAAKLIEDESRAEIGALPATGAQ